MSRLITGAEYNRRIVERLKRFGFAKKYAKLTAYDSATGAYSWTRQVINEKGQRIDDPNGETGTPTWCPAYGVGDGNIISDFPVEVTLRPTNVTASVGLAYEFPAYCGCVSGFPNSSTGVSGGTVLTDCCPEFPTPIVLFCTMIKLSGSCDPFARLTLNSFRLTNIPGTAIWLYAPFGNECLSVALQCVANSWQWHVNSPMVLACPPSVRCAGLDSFEYHIHSNEPGGSSIVFCGTPFSLHFTFTVHTVDAFPPLCCPAGLTIQYFCAITE